MNEILEDWETNTSFRSFLCVLNYRIRRFWFIHMPRYTAIIIAPLSLLLELVSYKVEISPEAKIGGGLRIVHPSAGIVISKCTIAQKRLTLYGGNGICIQKKGCIHIGQDVTLGFNSMILSNYIIVADNTVVGANSILTHHTKHGQMVKGPKAQ